MMNSNKPYKLFISYNHDDEKHIDKFIKHISPIVDNKRIEFWYDRNINGGRRLFDEIDNHIYDADIVLVCISSNYLSSSACKEELDISIKLNIEKCVKIIPIIISHCGWLDNLKLNNIMAMPNDGKPIDTYENVDLAWNEIYNGFKNVCDELDTYNNVAIKREFSLYLDSTDLLTKSHSKKEELFLSDIYVYPDVNIYNSTKEHDGIEKSENIETQIINNGKVILAGESQSGKTTFCKILFVNLRKRNYFPVLVWDSSKYFQGKIINYIKKCFNNQYDIDFEKIEKNRLIIIVDDFYLSKDKEKHISDLSVYNKCLLVVDDIFGLNLNEENLIKEYTQFQIRELSPTKRYQLLKKWNCLTAHGENKLEPSCVYGEIDKSMEFVNSSLGKVIGSGIMPSYPFFVLTVLSTYETFEKPIDQEITSQGYCYQALIYFYLRKFGVKNEDVDTYVNYLTELSFYFYDSNKFELSIVEYEEFINKYSEKFNLPVNPDTIISNLSKTKIVLVDSFNNIRFNYKYIYYFFVAKYFSDHIDVCKSNIDSIVNNLHTDENVYISIFISHHSKSNYVLDELLINSLYLFNDYEPAKLTLDELSFFDKEVDAIVSHSRYEHLVQSKPEQIGTEQLQFP